MTSRAREGAFAFRSTFATWVSTVRTLQFSTLTHEVEPENRAPVMAGLHDRKAVIEADWPKKRIHEGGSLPSTSREALVSSQPKRLPTPLGPVDDCSKQRHRRPVLHDRSNRRQERLDVQCGCGSHRSTTPSNELGVLNEDARRRTNELRNDSNNIGAKVLLAGAHPDLLNSTDTLERSRTRWAGMKVIPTFERRSPREVNRQWKRRSTTRRACVVLRMCSVGRLRQDNHQRRLHLGSIRRSARCGGGSLWLRRRSGQRGPHGPVWNERLERSQREDVARASRSRSCWNELPRWWHLSAGRRRHQRQRHARFW